MPFSNTPNNNPTNPLDTLPSNIQELYISLLCQYEAKSVYNYLVIHHNYNLDHILKLCQQYQINDATAYLLERFGNPKSALELILTDINHLLINKLLIKTTEEATDNLLSEEATDHDMVNQLDLLKNNENYQQCYQYTLKAIQLCQRTLDANLLWFNLLDCFLSKNKK